MMNKDLKTRLSSKFHNISFDDTHWSIVLTGANNVPVFYMKSMTDYYSQYHEGKNISFVVVEQNLPICALPLFAYLENDKWNLSSNGSAIIPPLFIKDIPKKTKKRMSKLLKEIICFLSRELEIRSINICEHSSTISDWYLLWLRESKRDFLNYHFAINLLQNIEQIKLGFRKSYKPLVSKGFREWDIQICEENFNDDFEEFRLLHLEVAGRETRSIETWKIQKDQIRKKEAFLVTVRDKAKLIGAGFFNHSKDIGIYSVGAYKRDMFDKPIGHAVQMAAIQKLKNLGCKLYYLGLMANKFNCKEISEKELSISYFKEGFASHVIAQPNLVVNFND